MSIKADRLDWGKMKEHTERALEGFYKMDSNLAFPYGDIPDFTLTPRGSCMAEMTFPVGYHVGGEEASYTGRMYVKVFGYGDGTGNEDMYKTRDLKFPSSLQHVKNKSNLVPRSYGTKIHCGLFFPLFSLDETGKFASDHVVSLEVYGIDFIDGTQKVLKKECDLGIDPHGFRVAHTVPITKRRPDIHLTVGSLPAGKGFGRSHAIFNGLDHIQVAGLIYVNYNDTVARVAADAIIEKWFRSIEKF
ncbi:MAG: hypothetical protein ABIA21_00425 [Candidatus Aenigmatarchaeota archaeon]